MGGFKGGSGMSADPEIAGTGLTMAEISAIGAAMHARWNTESEKPAPLKQDDTGWADLFLAGQSALKRCRTATPTTPTALEDDGR